MIRRNWSLAAEVKKNERKQQQRIQQRQKYQHKQQKLSSIDPIRLYKQIKSLEYVNDTSEKHLKYIKSLKEDWEFIIKNGLHKDKLEPFLNKLKQEEKAKLQASKKLWGQKSIYFNPELNPFGKVPSLLPEKPIRPLPNYTVPLKSKVEYEKDRLIDELGVVLPQGEPPKFYKLVQNTTKPDNKKDSSDAIELTNAKSVSAPSTSFKKKHIREDSDSDYDNEDSDLDTEEADNWMENIPFKKQKLE